MIRRMLRLLGVRTTVVGIIAKNKKILLEKRNKRMPEGGKWCLPGGRMDLGETVEHAIKREIKEELGFDVKSAKFLFYFDEIVPKLAQSVVMVFKTEIYGREKLGWEVSDAKWFNQKEIETLNIAFKHRDIIKKFFKDFKK